MRIAWFTHRYFPCIGGAETYGRAMVRRFVESGHEVEVYTSNAHDLAYYTDPDRKRVDAPEVSVVDGATVHRLPVAHFPYQRYVGKALSFVPHWPTRCMMGSYLPIIPRLGSIRGRFDLVYGVGFPFTNFSYAALRTARAAHAPLILTPFLHLATPGDPVHRTYTQWHQIRLLKEADLVVNPTPKASETIASWGIPTEKILTLSMAIEREEVTGGDRDSFRRKWNLDPSTPLIGQLGALDPNKGTCDLIRAVARMNESERRVNLVLSGNPTREFERFLQDTDHRSQPWLTLTGPLPSSDIPTFYAALDIFSMPSRTDSFGIVFLEAWANGLPVVAADAGGVPEVVESGKTGLLVPFGDVDALVARFHSLIDSPDLARALGTAGRSLVESGHTWEDRFAKLVAASNALRPSSRLPGKPHVKPSETTLPTRRETKPTGSPGR
jgi:glycosyltransferase involved in cell wall biosynthesis